MRRTNEKIDYDPYESVHCKSDNKVIKGSEVQLYIKCDSDESMEQIYESLGKYTVNPASSETSSRSEGTVKTSSTESTPEKKSCDLYAKVKKTSLVSNGPNLNSDFVSIYQLTKGEFNAKEDSIK